MNKFILLILVASIYTNSYSQSVAITFDDVPNTKKYQQDNYQSILLGKLDTLSIPIAIFINEGLIYKGGEVSKNFELLDNWINKEYITLGNHAFSHSRYPEVGLELFKIDVEKGESITRELAKKYGKTLNYFRFPYNDLGNDSIQHKEIEQFLTSKSYSITPFTVESADWMFNHVYNYYLQNDEHKKAKEIGTLYLEKTTAYFNFFDAMTKQIYGRSVKHIYLCHDNSLNADYFPELIKRLEKMNYSFISLDEAMKDEIYQQEDVYYKKWGISWLYRWMSTQKERVQWMKQEPNMEIIEGLYNELTKK